VGDNGAVELTRMVCATSPASVISRAKDSIGVMFRFGDS
jgi:hypothetical protein